MNILLASSEVTPFAKAGGLADVAGALPKYVAAPDTEVRVILPKYEQIPAQYRSRMKTIAVFRMQLGWRNQYCGIQQLEHEGIQYYFVDNEHYFKRTGLYGYDDEAERFVFFSRAVIEALPYIDYWPDIIHCHDWQTGVIPYALRTKYAGSEIYRKIKTVFTIHNLHYQGVFSHAMLRDVLNLEDGDNSLRELDMHDGASCLKGGLYYADWLTTVSPSYAGEIQTPEHGEYLDGLLRWRNDKLVGIINGIDENVYDPMNDSHIVSPYRDDLRNKRVNKLALQNELGWTGDGQIPVIGMVTRLVEQKGLDLVMAIWDELLNERLQIVILGTGEERYERFFREAARRRPDKVSSHITFHEGLARKIYAASDLFLMPSRFEPCGIGQLLAMRYRSIPIVRETGGLRDTVRPYDETCGDGWGFSFTSYNAHDMLYTIRRALRMYRNSKHWSAIHRNLALLSFGWSQSAERYRELYRQVLSE